MRKFITFILVFLFIGMQTASAISAFDIRWGTDLNSNMRSNTLKQWTESIEGRVGGSGTNLGTGSIFYVDSNVTTEGDGTSWADARDTLDEAVGLCTANNGDVIYVAQGHAETIAAADGVDVDVAGVTIIGVGSGDDAPEFLFSATGSEFVIGAANVTVENLRFLAGVSAITMGISVEADGDYFTLVNCVFPLPTVNSYEFLDTIDVASGATYVAVIGCYAQNDDAGAAPAHFIDLGNNASGEAGVLIAGNTIRGDFSVSAIWCDEPSTQVYIVNNNISNLTADQHCIEFTDAATGICSGNNLFTNAEATTLDPGSLECYENYITTTTDVSGQISFRPDDGINQLNATTITAISAAVDALDGVGVIGLCETNVTTTTVVSAALGGFGDDAFLEGWSLMCIFDTGGAVGTAPSGEVRDITDYVSTGGTFTTAAWTAALTAGDYVLLTPTHLIPKDYGKVIFCDDGGSNGEGTSWQTAKTTLAAAEAIAAVGDTILVGESHNENITTGGDLINIAGVTIIGMGEGDTRPLFDFDATADELTLDAAGITLRNLRFRPGATVVTACIRVEDAALGATIDSCAFEVGEGAGEEFIDCISVDALAEGLTVSNCTAWNANATAGDSNTWLNLDEVTIDDCTVIGNTVFGTFDEACIWGGAAIPVNVSILDNILTNATSGQLAIEFAGAATGIIANNILAGDTYGAILDPGSARCYGNTQTVGVNSAAIDVPLVAGQTYALTKTDGTAHSDDLFSVAGGPILITSLTGFCITAVGGQVTTTIICDAAVDKEFTTAVDIDTLEEGGLLVFSNANPAVLTILGVAANSGAGNLMSPWYCPVGMIENVNDDSTQTGVISWSMTFIPLTDGVVVVPK